MGTLFLLMLPQILALASPAFGNTLLKTPSFSLSMSTHVLNFQPSSKPPSPAYALAPLPLRQGCNQICVDPLTSTPIGSPCGCVFPMKVRLLLDVSLYVVFPGINELEIEVAAGTYLLQSQVTINGANVDSQNQERTIVDIYLIPLEEKFDNTTAILTYERFWQKKVLLNKTLFINYEVISISYPGIPSLPPDGGYTDGDPIGSPGNGQFPKIEDLVQKGKKMNSIIISIIALSGVILLVVCFGAIFVLLKWRDGILSNAIGPVFTPSKNKRHGKGSTLSSSMGSSPTVSLISAMPTLVPSVKMFTHLELEKATNKFSLQRLLGEGGFGRVFLGILEDGSNVAVKLLTRDNQNGDREFIAEVEMLSRVHHRNVVKLIGICFEERIRCLVYELIPNGNVESHLHGTDKMKKSLDWDARLKIALGAARGLAYLHEDSNPRVIHRDFKASNVLLENDFTPKVSDFGLAREATEGNHHISTRVMGTFGYVAPEYAMTGHLLVKSDVYSYGVVLLELLSGRKPVDMSQPTGEENLVTWARPLLGSREGLEQLVDPSLAGTYIFDDMAKVASIASKCVTLEVTHRPFMGEVVQALKLIYNNADVCQESSVRDSDFKDDFIPSDGSWGNAAGSTPPRFLQGHMSPFGTMEDSSGTFEETENQSFSAYELRGRRMFYRWKGSMSEHGGRRAKDEEAQETSF